MRNSSTPRRKKPVKPVPKGRPQEFRLGFLVHDVSRMRQTLFDQAMKPLGVTRAQWWLLAKLSRNPERGMTQTELARVMEVGKVNIGGLIDRLETSGSVERRPDPNDRRVNRIFLTPTGQKIMDGMTAVGRVLNVKILDGIEDHEIKAAADILDRMKENIRKSLNGAALAEFED